MTERAKRIVRKLEWSATRQGPGSGPMFSGGDGTHWPACPLCGNLKPGTGGAREFISEAIGHKPRCEMKMLMKDVGA